MANTVNSKRSLGVQVSYDFDTTIGHTISTIQTNSNYMPNLDVTWSYGTGAGQFNQLVAGVATISAGANSDLDLAGSLTNPQGTTVTFTGIKWMIFAVDSPDGTKKVRVGNEGTNPFNGPLSSGGTLDILQGQDFVNPGAAGWTVTAGTGDKLRLNNPGASSITVYYIIAGNG